MSFAVCRSSQALDTNSSSPHSNNAGSPLPSVPVRRRYSMPSPFHPTDPFVPSTTAQPQNSSRATGIPDADSESRPSGRAKAQHQIQPLLPVEPSHISTLEFPCQSPTSTTSPNTRTFPLSQNLPPSALDEPVLAADAAVIINPSPSLDGHIRKKSGEPLRSSLKSRAPTPRPSLAIITGKLPSKSEPGTPNHERSKSVSFANQLDHIKLYFPEQKPIAVSRDGSPKEDTSGTESEIPVPASRISSDEKKRLLVMEVVNMPQRWAVGVDVMLEDVTLSKEATICGHVKVRNVAFEKSVAVRFTFDFWQTTSEVTARYEQSLAHGSFDRFSFVIRLQDILAKIEDKTLFMAIRYVVNGRELWDNNFGQNYKMTFSLPSIPRPRGTIAQYVSDEEAVADLTQKLKNIQSNNRSHRRKRSGSAEHTFFNPSVPLSTRYKWGSSEPRKPTVHSTPRTTHPASSIGFPSSQEPSHSFLVDRRQRPIQPQAPNLTRGSPRLGGDNPTSEIAALLHEGAPVRRASFRNHIRGSLDFRSHNLLFDTGSPAAKTSEAVSDHVPPRDKVAESFHIPGGIERLSGDDSSTTSSSSSSEPSPVVITATTPGPPSSIISRFCFYSGTETGMTLGLSDDGGVLAAACGGEDDGKGLGVDVLAFPVPEEAMERSHSTSTIEHILRRPQGTVTPTERPRSPNESRSLSYDDLGSFSEPVAQATTPTKARFAL